jgi:hypothetical protein
VAISFNSGIVLKIAANLKEKIWGAGKLFQQKGNPMQDSWQMIAGKTDNSVLFSGIYV